MSDIDIPEGHYLVRWFGIAEDGSREYIGATLIEGNRGTMIRSYATDMGGNVIFAEEWHPLSEDPFRRPDIIIP